MSTIPTEEELCHHFPLNGKEFYLLLTKPDVTAIQRLYYCARLYPFEGVEDYSQSHETAPNWIGYCHPVGGKGSPTIFYSIANDTFFIANWNGYFTKHSLDQ